MSTGVDLENLEMTKVPEKVGAISNRLKKKTLTSTLTRLYKKSGERGHSLSLLDPHMVKRTKLSSTDLNYIWPVWGYKAVSYLSHEVFYLFIIIHHITDDYN